MKYTVAVAQDYGIPHRAMHGEGGTSAASSADGASEVRIALVGEEGVGKTSLLMSLLEVSTVEMGTCDRRRVR